MSLNVSPGTVVQVTVTRNPTSQRAAKTLSRVFGRDAANKRLAIQRHRILRQTAEDRRRGGRLWTVKSRAPRLVQPRSGDTCRIRATVDILPDLNSLARFISVTPSS